MCMDEETRFEIEALRKENAELRKEMNLFKRRLLSGLYASCTDIDFTILSEYLDGKRDSDGKADSGTEPRCGVTITQ